MVKNMAIIYKTTNLISGKIYVGQHYTSADDGYLGSSKSLKMNIRILGKDNFKRETLEYCTSCVDQREIYWIEALSARNPDIGYNILKGGTGGTTKGFHHTKETKIKISKARNGKYKGKDNPNFGNGEKIKGDKNPSKRLEVKEKISKFWKGRTRTEENKQKLSNAKIGKKLSEEHQKSLSKWIYRFINIFTQEILETEVLSSLCNKMGWNKNTINYIFYTNRNIYKDWKIERRKK